MKGIMKKLRRTILVGIKKKAGEKKAVILLAINLIRADICGLIASLRKKGTKDSQETAPPLAPTKKYGIAKFKEELAEVGCDSTFVIGNNNEATITLTKSALSAEGVTSVSKCTEGNHFLAFEMFVKEVNARKNRLHTIYKWEPCTSKSGNDYEKVAILADTNAQRRPQLYVARVYYKNDTKDGSPRVSCVRTRDFMLKPAAPKKLNQKTLDKSILDLLKKPELLPYCERVYNTIAEDGEGVFNAVVALKISKEEFEEKYGTKSLQKAWVAALGQRFGGELEPAKVEPKANSTGCFRIKFVS